MDTYDDENKAQARKMLDLVIRRGLAHELVSFEIVRSCISFIYWSIFVRKRHVSVLLNKRNDLT